MSVGNPQCWIILAYARISRPAEPTFRSRLDLGAWINLASPHQGFAILKIVEQFAGKESEKRSVMFQFDLTFTNLATQRLVINQTKVIIRRSSDQRKVIHINIQILGVSCHGWPQLKSPVHYSRFLENIVILITCFDLPLLPHRGSFVIISPKGALYVTMR